MLRTSYVTVAFKAVDPTARHRIAELTARDLNGRDEPVPFSCIVALGDDLAQLPFDASGSGAPPEALRMDTALDRLDRFFPGSTLVTHVSDEFGERLCLVAADLRVPLLDTAELASLLAPGLLRGTLASVAQALCLESAESRAPADSAELTGHVFRALQALAESLSAECLQHVNRISAGWNWPLRPLFLAAERATLRRSRLDPAPSQPRVAEQLPDELRGLVLPPLDIGAQPSMRGRGGTIDPDLVAAALSPDSALAARFPGFEARPQQVEMARAVARALNAEEALVVEAGTGTGKSLAYLLPAVKFALNTGCRVVVSTQTINLQDQLFRKDIPELRASLGEPFVATLLKGRENYLCLSRWLTLLRAPVETLSADERAMLIKTLLWLQTTLSGDRAELALQPHEEQVWWRLAAQTEHCTPGRCSYHRTGLCYLARGRRAAEHSHLIVVNHALLLSDLQAQPRILPEYRHVIVDEAHQLEQVATSQLGRRVARRELIASLERLAPLDGSKGRLGEARELALRHAGDRTDQAIAVEALISSATAVADEARAAVETTLRTLSLLAREHGDSGDTGQITLRLSPALRRQPDWDEIEVLWDTLGEPLPRLTHLLAALIDLLGQWEGEQDIDPLLSELEDHHERWIEGQALLGQALLEPSREVVYWLGVSRAGDDIAVNSAPLQVGPLLREKLVVPRATSVFTSATLTTAGSFDYVCNRLGIDDAVQLRVGSPFEYAQSALLYLPHDMPDPDQAHYQSTLEHVVFDVACRLQGRTLVLFTSYSQLRATHRALRKHLVAQGIALLAQGEDGASRAQLLERFRRGARAVLLGTASFWEGVDVVGDALSCVIVARLPFSVPSDPVFAARSELFERPFGEYALPNAILRLKQGLGRLIRSKGDRGVAIVLDQRIVTRAYGRSFLQSLPPFRVVRGPVASSGEVAVEFLDEHSAQAVLAVERTASPE